MSSSAENTKKNKISLHYFHELNLQLSAVYHLTFEPPESPDVTRRLVPVENQTEKSVRKQLIHYHRNLEGIKNAVTKGTTKHINADQPKSDVYSQGRFSQLTF